MLCVPILLIHGIACALAAPPQSAVLSEAVVTLANQLVFVTHTADQRSNRHLYAFELSKQSEMDVQLCPEGASIRGGPLSWGIAVDAHYFLGSSDRSEIVQVRHHRLADSLAVERSRREGNVNWELWNEMNERGNGYGRVLTPLMEEFERLTREGILRRDYVFSCDLTYPSANHVTFILIREGRLQWWTFNKPEETDWVDRGTIDTEIDGNFRIMQAGEDMYLIDFDGRVFSSPAEGHEQLGTIAGWNDVREGERLILLEDQQQEKIAALTVSDADVVTVLRFEGDERAGEDFVTEISSEELSAALLRMDEILDEEEGDQE